MKLYHYCRIQELFSIVENKVVWFSDLLNSNDPFEDTLLLKWFFEYAKTKRNTLSVSLAKEDFEKARNTTSIYGMCLSEKCDDIRQWMNYAPENGVAIEFDKDELDEYFKKISVLQKSAEFCKVEYSSSPKKYSRLFKTLLEKYDTVYGVYGELIAMCAKVKSDDWKKEKEWRCYFRNFIDKGLNESLPSVKHGRSKCKIDYRFRNNVPVFHYEIPFCVKLIKRIIIGPNNAITPQQLARSLKIINPEIELSDEDIVRTKEKIVAKNN